MHPLLLHLLTVVTANLLLPQADVFNASLQKTVLMLVHTQHGERSTLTYTALHVSWLFDTINVEHTTQRYDVYMCLRSN
jgi:hypothetical protein